MSELQIPLAYDFEPIVAQKHHKTHELASIVVDYCHKLESAGASTVLKARFLAENVGRSSKECLNVQFK